MPLQKLSGTAFSEIEDFLLGRLIPYSLSAECSRDGNRFSFKNSLQVPAYTDILVQERFGIPDSYSSRGWVYRANYSFDSAEELAPLDQNHRVVFSNDQAPGAALESTVLDFVQSVPPAKLAFAYRKARARMIREKIEKG